jgi:glycosyltransferase involved in cell wall biosynthesis
MKSLLIISPEYPYPQKCGFTVRVGDLCRHLAQTVTLDLFVCRNLADPESMPGREVFRHVFAAGNGPAEAVPDLGLAERIARRLAPPHFDDPRYLPDAILAQLAKIQSREKYDACMIQTPLLARCLPAVGEQWHQGQAMELSLSPPSRAGARRSQAPGCAEKNPDAGAPIRNGPIVIIDAHDIWHQKYLGFKALGCGNLLAQFRDAERELAFYRTADHVLAISLWDHEYLLAHGVNSIYTPVSFVTEPLPERSPPGHDLLMASGSGPFNIDAIHFFIAEVLPLVLKKIPDVRLKIANPAPEITKDYSAHPQVILLPFLDHPRDLYAQADLAIAPLRFTSGLKIKVLEAFAFGKPIILSTAAAQGIPIAKYPQRNITIEPETFANEVVAALQDEAYRKALANSGLKLIRNEYAPEKAYRELIEYSSSTLDISMTSPVFPA